MVRAKTASTVVLTTSGTACLSSDNTTLTVSVTSADPSYLGAGNIAADYIQMSRPDATEPFSGNDYGAFAGNRSTGQLHQRSVEPPVVARLIGYGAGAANVRGRQTGLTL